MNNKEFDNLIKDGLKGFSATPSADVGKGLSRKMFFRNIWFFHKGKALLILAFISGITAFNLWETKENNVLSTGENEKVAQIDGIKKNTPSTNDLSDNELEYSSSKEITKHSDNTELIVFNENKTSTENTTNNSSTRNIKTTSYHQEEKASLKKDKKSTSLTNQDKQKSKEILDFKKQIKKSNQAKNTRQDANNQSRIVHFDTQTNKNETKETLRKFKRKNYQEMILPPLELAPYEVLDVAYNEDYAKKHRFNFSFDAYMTPYNKVNIVNQVEEKYQSNWWDFYTNKGYQNSGMEFGLRGNVEWKNIIFSLGIKYNRVVDYKPMYKHEEIEGDFLIEAFELDEISGVQVLAEDSAHYVFYTEDDEDLINHLENDKFNTYTYASIPISLGYQFQYSVFTFAVSGGMVYNKIAKVQGTYLKRYQSNEKFDIYYNKGIETSLLTKQNDMLRSSFISYLGTVILNIAVSPSFDCFGEFNYTVGKTPITNEDYMITKTYSNYGMNFGIRYHLNPRLKGNQSNEISF